MTGSYRIYCLDRGNQVVKVEWVTAPTDEEAMRVARALKTSAVRELWLGDRLVGTVTVAIAEDSSASCWF